MCLNETDILSTYPNKITFPYEAWQLPLPVFFMRDSLPHPQQEKYERGRLHGIQKDTA